MVMNLPERDKHGYSIKYLKARMAVCFGGRVAEEIIFGKDDIQQELAVEVDQILIKLLNLLGQW